MIAGNFTGTLAVYAVLLVYRHEQLGLTLDRPLLRRMNRFGLPLVPSMLALWMLNFGDRFFILKLADASEVGVYSIGSRIASAMVLLLTAFRAAWPAFAFSIEDDERARTGVLLRAHVPALRRVVGRARAWACSRRGSWSG